MTWFQTFTDDFNRADGALGNNWLFIIDDPANTISILNNRARIVHPQHVVIGSVNGHSYAYRSDSDILTNTRVQCLLKAGSPAIDLIARKSGGSFAIGSVTASGLELGRSHVARSGDSATYTAALAHDTSHDQIVTLDVVGGLVTLTVTDQTDFSSITLSYSPPSGFGGGMPASGACGFRNTADGNTANLDWFTVFSDVVPPLAAGSVFRVRNSPSAPEMLATAGANGTGPYTYQWKRSTVSGSGYVNASGGTTLAFTDSARASDTDYYYVIQVTDSLAATALSSELHIKTQPANYQTLHVAVIGDSLINGFFNAFAVSPLVYMLSALSANPHYSGGATVPVNEAVDGTATIDWMPSDAYGLFQHTLNDVFSYGCNIALIMLGTNDSKDPATSNAVYLSRMQAITAALVASGVKVFVSYMGWLDSSGPNSQYYDGSVPALLGYLTQIDALHNGATIFRIGQSPTNLFTTVQNAPGTYLNGKVHLSQAGESLFGSTWAHDIDVFLFVADTTPPSAPAGANVQVSSVGKLLAWTAASDDTTAADGLLYHVYEDGGSTPIGTTLPGVTSFNVIRPVGDSHSYEIDAQDAAGNRSAKSSPLAVIFPSTSLVLSIGTDGSGHPVLTWTPESGAAHYLILRSATAQGAPTLVAVVAAPTLTYTDAGGSSGNFYAIVSTQG